MTAIEEVEEVLWWLGLFSAIPSDPREVWPLRDVTAEVNATRLREKIAVLAVEDALAWIEAREVIEDTSSS